MEKTRLPDFENPPVAEVVLSAQFEPLEHFQVPHIGLLWQEYRAELPKLEEHSPLAHIIEQFGPTSLARDDVHVEVTTSPPRPRCWFLNERQTVLIQVQSDRFAHNWRRVEGEQPYPRYERIRQDFEKSWQAFEAFVDREKLGRLVPDQCEIAYVNVIPVGAGPGSPADVSEVITPLQVASSVGFLGRPEDMLATLRFRIPGPQGDPVGRLIASIEPGFRRANSEPVIVLKLVARGGPLGSNSDGILEFLDNPQVAGDPHRLPYQRPRRCRRHHNI